MKKTIIVVALLLLIVGAGAEIAYVGWQYSNRTVLVDPTKEIDFNGKLLRKWIDDLASEDVAVRRKAAETLIEISPRDGQYAVTPLLKACGDKDHLTRCHAASAVAHITSEIAVPAPIGSIVTFPLIEVLKDEDPKIRTAGAKALGSFGRSMGSAVPALTELAKSDTDADVRQAAASAVERIRPAAGPSPSTKPAPTPTTTKSAPGSADPKRPSFPPRS